MSTSKDQTGDFGIEVGHADKNERQDTSWFVEADRAKRALMPPRYSHHIIGTSRGCNPLPAYIKHEGGQSSISILLSFWSADPVGRSMYPNLSSIVVVEERSRLTSEGILPIRFSPPRDHSSQQERIATIGYQRFIVSSFYDAITRKLDDVTISFIDNGLVTANTTSRDGGTPLVAAVAAESVRIVQELIRLGADCNAFGNQVIQLAAPPAVVLADSAAYCTMEENRS